MNFSGTKNVINIINIIKVNVISEMVFIMQANKGSFYIPKHKN